MSYDIVTKGHDGRLRVESEPGSGATFIIELPISRRPMPVYVCDEKIAMMSMATAAVGSCLFSHASGIFRGKTELSVLCA